MSPHSEKSEARPGAGPDTAGDGGLAEAGGLVRLGFLTFQLLLLLAVIRGFRIQEGFGFLRLLPLLPIGFVANAVAPRRLRPPLFALLSLAGIGLVLPFPSSLMLITLGLALLGICHLPVALVARVALLVAAGAALAAVRGGWLEVGPVELPTLVLPVLAAMFMFRLVIYLYDLRHERHPASLWERLSYFFMLPNVCFLLFPVVDFSRFRRTYYDAPAHQIYQKGLAWMVRGLLQLLLYRVVYQYFVPAPTAVQDPWSFLQFVLSSYLLYLHISGQFHLIVGILCLFGFNLPTTHHLYYLAPDFNSFWRRINIYWRDFMSKLVFYPTFAALGGRPMTVRLIAATVTVFVGTWLLHSYQSFWLRGDFLLQWRDVVFWGVLGVLVVVTSLREVRSPESTEPQDRPALRRALRRSLTTLGTFSVICVLWSLWSSPSVAEWLAYASRLGAGTGSDALALLGLLLAVVGLGTVAGLTALRRRAGRRPGDDGPPWWDLAHARPGLYTTATGLVLVGLLGAQTLGWLGRSPDELLASLRRDRLNVRDQELADRGYYEGVVDAGSFASALWKGHLRRPPGSEWAFIRDTDFVRFTGDLLEYELETGYRGSWRDASFTTNAAGFRDADHPLAKPAGTRRIALLGASYEMGAGVKDDQIFPAVLEATLNDRQGDTRWEVLNLSVGGYGLVQRAELLRREGLAYRPDLVVLTLYTTEETRLLNHLAYLVAEEIPVPPFLEKLFARADLEPGMRRAVARQALQPYAGEVMRWALLRLAEDTAAQGVPLVAVTVPTAQDLANDPAGRHPKVRRTGPADFSALRRLAEDAGIRVFDLGPVYRDHPSEAVRLAPWDRHANVLGHRLLGEAFFDLLTDNETLRRLWSGPPEERPTP